VKLTQKATAYRSTTGKVIVYVENAPLGDGGALYSPDGVTYYELARLACLGIITLGHDRTDFTCSFLNPHSGEEGMWYHVGNAISFDRERYEQVPVPDEDLVVVPLPELRIGAYLCRDYHGRYYYVSRQAYGGDISSFKLHIGDAGRVRMQRDIRPAEYSDGTVSISCTGGTLRIPGYYSREPATWLAGAVAIELVSLGLDEYNIVESPDGSVCIAAKQRV